MYQNKHTKKNWHPSVRMNRKRPKKYLKRHAPSLLLLPSACDGAESGLEAKYRDPYTLNHVGVSQKRVRRNTGPGFSVKTCVFHVFLRIAAIKTVGSRMEISYVFFL